MRVEITLYNDIGRHILHWFDRKRNCSYNHFVDKLVYVLFHFNWDIFFGLCVGNHSCFKEELNPPQTKIEHIARYLKIINTFFFSLKDIFLKAIVTRLHTSKNDKFRYNKCKERPEQNYYSTL